jgi:methylmalonyl-CoA mutase N-terminal domain/subunit
MARRESKQDKSLPTSDSRVQEYREAVAKAPARKDAFLSLSGLPRDPLGVPDSPDEEYFNELGLPGEYPFTRGVYPTMYRPSKTCGGCLQGSRWIRSPPR